MRHFKRVSVILVFGCIIFFGTSYAQNTIHVQDTTEPLPQHLRITPVGDVNHGLSTPVDLDADDAFLPSILATLAEYSGYNIVTGPEVNDRQRISIHLKKTPIEEAINLVVRAAGLSYEIVGNSFLVTKHENLEKQVGVSSYLIELQYAKAAEMREFLKDLTPNIQVDSSHNALLISTSPKVIGEIKNTIARLDVPAKQIVLQTRVIEVQVDKIKSLGIDWQKLSHISAILAERPYDPENGSRSPSFGELVESEFGTPELEIFQKIEGLKNIGYFDRQLTAFDITLDLLLKTNNAKLLTDAKLTTMNNRRASIHIGEVIPFVVRSTESARIEREKVGINIDIIPQINDDGFITATVKPEASTIIELIGGEIPRKKVRTAETTVLVKNRQKIIIGGLLNTEEGMDVQTIPFFGELPFFGSLFKHYDTKKITTDLIIEITPYILSNVDPYAEMIADSLFEDRTPIERFDEIVKKTTEEKKEPDTFGPTHLALMPTPDVLAENQFTVGVHELSIGTRNNLQLTFTPWQTIGRTRLAIKYKLMPPNVAIGIGYHRGMFQGEDRYTLKSRLGVFGVTSLVDTRPFRLHGEVDAQFGDYHSYGGAIGASMHFGKFFAVLGEFSNNYTPETPSGISYWDPWGTGAIRFSFPGIEKITFDLGVSLRATSYFADPVSEDLDDYTPMVYFDIAFTSFFKERK